MIDTDDFALDPPPKFFRLKPGGEVRLMGSYLLKYEDIKTDADGKIEEIFCTVDLETGNGNPADGRKVKGTIHWLSESESIPVDVKLFDELFTIENVADIPEGKGYGDYLNVDSVTDLPSARVEASIADAKPGDRFQFVRVGYFVKDTKYENTFNRIVGLKDSYKV